MKKKIFFSFTPSKFNALSFVFTFSMIVYFASINLITKQSFDGKGLSDYWLNYQWSLQTAENLSYNIYGFTYPPPGIIFRIILAYIGFEASAILWIVLMILSAIICIKSILYLLNLELHPYKYVLALLGFISVEYYIEWDLKSLNSNLIYFACVIGSVVFYKNKNPYLAGFLLAFSIALKIYSIVFLPYLLLKRQYRWLVATLLFMVMFFIVVPAIYFGISDSIKLIKSWILMVIVTSNMDFPFQFKAYLTSFHKVLLSLLNAQMGRGVTNVANLDVKTVFYITRTIQFTWLACIFIYFLPLLRKPVSKQDVTINIIDIGILLIMLLPLSPLLQPHHGVVMLVPAMVVVKFIFDCSQPGWLRYLLGPLPFVSFGVLKYAPNSTLKGGAMLFTIILFFVSLVLIRSSGKDSISETNI